LTSHVPVATTHCGSVLTVLSVCSISNIVRCQSHLWLVGYTWSTGIY